jgi:hypothetical protein
MAAKTSSMDKQIYVDSRRKIKQQNCSALHLTPKANKRHDFMLSQEELGDWLHNVEGRVKTFLDFQLEASFHFL